MKFREAYVSDMGAICPDEAVINNILLKMRREIETPAPWIRRVPTMRLATAAAGFCLLIAAAVVIPVLLSNAPGFDIGESEQNYAIADGGASPAPMSPVADSPYGGYAGAYNEDAEARQENDMSGMGFPAPVISETQRSRSTYDADDFGIVAESTVSGNEPMPGGGMSESFPDNEVNSSAIWDNAEDMLPAAAPPYGEYFAADARISSKAIVISGGLEYEIIENKWHDTITYREPEANRAKEINFYGTPLHPEQVLDMLHAVPYNDDFRIEFNEPLVKIPYYTLYDEVFNELYHEAEFTAPAQAGEYILIVSATWITEIEEGTLWSSYQYFIKFVIS